MKLVRGDEAAALMRAPRFKAEWTALHARCAWATSCQSAAFADAWYSVYGEVYEPLLVFAEDGEHGLSGLLALALHKETAALVHVGAQQAEYQVWLATPQTSDVFIETALDALAEAFPKGQLVLQFVPPRTPLEWRGKGRAWADRTLLIRSDRPLLTLGPGSPIEHSLRKKKNKSRLSSLRRSGRVRLVQLRSRAELASVLDQIANQYDFRQGAVSDTFPFRDDPRKKEFLLSLIEQPGLLSASALMLDDQVLAANMGLIDDGVVSIGTLSHSPFFAEHSPGKVLVLLLAKELGEQGFRNLDLTPGGTYKNRFADHRDEAHILEVRFDRLQHVRRLARQAIVERGKKFLVARGMEPDAIKTRALELRRRVAAGGIRAVPGTVVRLLRRNLYERQEMHVYILERGNAGVTSPSRSLNRNSLPDLLSYRPRRTGDKPRPDFLADAQDRLKAGSWAYTRMDNGVLTHCSWLATQDEGNLEFAAVAPPSGSYVLWDDYTEPAVNHVYEQSIAERISDAAARPDMDRLFMHVRAGDPAIEAMLTAAGFKLYGQLIRTTRFGKQSFKWMHAPGALEKHSDSDGKTFSSYMVLFTLQAYAGWHLVAD